MKRKQKEVDGWKVKRGAEFGLGRSEQKVKNKTRYTRKEKHKGDY